MKNQQVMENNKKSVVLTITGVAIICVISTFSHILGNAISLVAVFLSF